MKIRIDVTNDVIQQSEAWKRGRPQREFTKDPGWTAQCVLSRAIREHTRPDVEITACQAFVCIGGDLERINLPASCYAVVTAFDMGELISPMSFELDIPEEYLNEFAKEAPEAIRTEALATA